MSAIVKDLSAVSHCKDCELNKLNWGRCYQFLRGCPIVGELPDKRGRLIDADYLRQKLEKHRDMCGDIELSHGIDVAISILNNVPTIIEAEVNE